MNENKSLQQKLLHFPLTKIIIGLTVCISMGIVAQEGMKLLLNITLLKQEYKNLAAELTTTLFILITYKILFRFYEKRSITELSVKNLGKNFITGVLLGFILQSLIIYIIYLNNGFHVISKNSFIAVIPYLITVLADSITGQVLLIGIIFRITEEKLGSYLALIIFALIFGVIHLSGAQGSFVAALCIAIHAGILLGAAYIYTRNLWFPIAIHFAWDFAQAGIFGAAVSGHKISTSLITSTIEASPLISGGYFGPQASIQAGLFCLIAAIVLLVLSHKENKIVKINLSNSPRG